MLSEKVKSPGNWIIPLLADMMQVRTGGCTPPPCPCLRPCPGSGHLGSELPPWAQCPPFRAGPGTPQVAGVSGCVHCDYLLQSVLSEGSQGSFSKACASGGAEESDTHRVFLPIQGQPSEDVTEEETPQRAFSQVRKASMRLSALSHVLTQGPFPGGL